MTGIKVIFGGAMVSSNRAFKDKDDLEALFASLKKYGVKAIDTAQSYVDRRAFSGVLPTKENIITTTKESMKKLNLDKVDIFYTHAPDDSAPLSSTLAGVNEASKKSYFTRFGLSNYRVEDVKAVYNHCNENGYVLLTVYQGNYSPAARKRDTLFPTLRRLKIAFYAYNPLAGGFLTKTKEQIQQDAGRFGDALGGMYSNIYSKPEQGDGIIVGASSLRQFEQTMEGLKAGPLPDEAVKRIDYVWKTIEHDVPLDNCGDNVSLFKK